MATAFGRSVDVQRGEADVMTESVKSLFECFHGSTMPFDLFLISKCYLVKVRRYFRVLTPLILIMYIWMVEKLELMNSILVIFLL